MWWASPYAPSSQVVVELNMTEMKDYFICCTSRVLSSLKLSQVKLDHQKSKVTVAGSPAVS